MKTLYDLPKDMLIQMLTTLEKRIKEDYDKEYSHLKIKSKIFDSIMAMINGDYRDMAFVDYHICNQKGCENYCIENEHGIHFSTSNIFFCVNCDKCFCETHNKDFHSSNEYCDECHLELQ